MAFDEVHYEVLPLAGNHEMIRDPRQVRVPQAGKDPGFPFKLSGEFLGGEEIFFDGYFNIQVPVPGLIYRAHSPLAKDGFNLITIEKSLARLKRHRGVILANPTAY